MNSLWQFVRKWLPRTENMKLLLRFADILQNGATTPCFYFIHNFQFSVKGCMNEAQWIKNLNKIMSNYWIKKNTYQSTYYEKLAWSYIWMIVEIYILFRSIELYIYIEVTSIFWFDNASS